jgi:hypothetical protein
MSLLFSISHERLKALRWVTAVAAKHVNITEHNPSFEDWEKALKVVREVVDNISLRHIEDARENGNCETCAPDAFALKEKAKEYALEKEEFDRQLASASTS